MQNGRILTQTDWGAVKGTDVKDICNLVGGMSTGETVKIKATDGFSKTFPYEYIYSPNPRQGPMGITGTVLIRVMHPLILTVCA